MQSVLRPACAGLGEGSFVDETKSFQQRDRRQVCLLGHRNHRLSVNRGRVCPRPFDRCLCGLQGEPTAPVTGQQLAGEFPLSSMIAEVEDTHGQVDRSISDHEAAPTLPFRCVVERPGDLQPRLAHLGTCAPLDPAAVWQSLACPVRLRRGGAAVVSSCSRSSRSYLNSLPERRSILTPFYTFMQLYTFMQPSLRHGPLV